MYRQENTIVDNTELGTQLLCEKGTSPMKQLPKETKDTDQAAWSIYQ